MHFQIFKFKKFKKYEIFNEKTKIPINEKN